MKHLYIIIILSLLFIFSNKSYSDEPNHWKKIFDGQTAFDTCIGHDQYFQLVNIYKIDSSNFLAYSNLGSDYNKILTFTEGGAKWKMIMDSKGDTNLIDISSFTVLNQDSIILVSAYISWRGYYSVFRTTNGGLKWDTVNFYNNGNSFKFLLQEEPNFLKKGIGILLTIDLIDSVYSILKTTDFGLSWEKIPLYLNFKNITAFQIFSENCYGGWCYNQKSEFYQGKYCRTDDGGKTWNEIFGYPPTKFAMYRKFLDSLTCWAVYSKDSIYDDTNHIYIDIFIKTTDGGYTWKQLYSNSYENTGFTSIDILDSNNVIFFQFGGAIYRTKDGGKNWIFDTTMITIENYPILTGRLISPTRFIAGTQTGEFDRIYLYDENGFPDDVQEEITGNNQLSIIPNPAFNNCIIKASLNEPCKLSLQLLSTLGLCVLPAINDFADAGTYTKQIDLSSLAPGVYFVVINTGKERLVQKFVKVE